MSKKTKTGAKVAAGWAEPRPQIIEVMPFMGMSEAQISAKVRQAQGLAPSGSDRVLQSLFTVRKDTTVDDALETVNCLLYQVHGVVTTLSDDASLDGSRRATAWGLLQLIEQAQAALCVVDSAFICHSQPIKVEP